jgi:hypothetical protein
MDDRTCSACGYHWVGPCSPCPECGGTSVSVKISLSGASLDVSTAAGRLGNVADEPATSERPHRIRAETPLGAKSSSEFDPHDGFKLRAIGRSDAGEDGEPQVVRTLIEYLTRRGIAVEEILPATAKRKQCWNAVGIDARLRVRGKPFSVQITAVPQAPQHWHAASRGEGILEGSVNDATRMIHEAIEKKRTAASPEMILALDARHAGPVVEPTVTAEYLRVYGDPSILGFAAIVIVGPTAALSATLASNFG